MYFRERSIGAFIDAREEASNLLKARTGIGRVLNLYEGFVLQACAELAANEPAGKIYMHEIAELTTLSKGSVHGVMANFINMSLFDRLEPEPLPGRRGSPRAPFLPTELGKTTLSFFGYIQVEEL